MKKELIKAAISIGLWLFACFYIIPEGFEWAVGFALTIELAHNINKH